MDGFKVVKLEDVCHFVDIVITCTGKAGIISCDHFSVCVARREAQHYKEAFGQIKKWLHSR